MRRVRYNRAFAALMGVVVPVGTLLAASSVAHASEADVRKQLQAQIDTISAALKKKDAEGVLRNFTPDYTTQEISGKIHNRAEYTALLKQNFSVIASMNTVSASIMNCKVMGDKAVTEDMEKLDFTAVGPGDKPGSKGQSHHIEASVPSRHTWVKTGGKWLVQKNEDMPGATLRVDGKDVTPTLKTAIPKK